MLKSRIPESQQLSNKTSKKSTLSRDSAQMAKLRYKRTAIKTKQKSTHGSSRKSVASKAQLGQIDMLTCRS